MWVEGWVPNPHFLVPRAMGWDVVVGGHPKVTEKCCPLGGRGRKMGRSPAFVENNPVMLF